MADSPPDGAEPPQNNAEPQQNEHHEIDSVMGDNMTEPRPGDDSLPAASPAPTTTSPLFVAQSTAPPTPAPETPLLSDAAIQAMKDYQRHAAMTFIEQSGGQYADSPFPQSIEAAMSPAPAAMTDDGFSEILQRPKSINDDQAKEFSKLKKQFNKKQKAGTLTIEEEIDFMRKEAGETARQRKIQRDAEADNPPIESDIGDNDLFVGYEEMPSFPNSSDGDLVHQPKKRGRKRKSDDEGASKRSAKKPAASKKNRKVAGQDYSEADLDIIMAESSKARKSGKASKATKASKPKQVSKSKAAKAGPSMTNTTNLAGTNIFRDAAAVQDLPDQPTHEGGTRRPDAMKALIASIPEDDLAVAKSDQKYLDAAIKDFDGQGAVKPAIDGNWAVRGVRTTLKHYQVMGTAFMRRRENGNAEPRGGIMADAMGLGKTLMTLANIVNGKPPGNKRTLRTTLIVAAPALVNQWFHEIQKHCLRRSEHREAGIGGVYQHRAGHRLDSNMDEETLANADIILTTYSEVNRSYPRADPPKELVTAKEKDEWWRTHYEENKGFLHRMKYLRVVLDEAQAIKNHKSVSSMACRALSARHHWALTGTPIYNSVSEFYSIFKFLREPHTGSFRIFKENFCDPSDPDGLTKLNVFLRKLMVRRTHLDKLFGARLLSLPNPSERTVKLEFGEIERQIYEIVKHRMVSRINCISKQEGQTGLVKKFNHIWTMVLRLRQLCCHILLIQGVLLDFLEREDFEKLNRLAATVEAEATDEGAPLLIHLKRALSARSGVKTVDGANGATIRETQIIATGTVDIHDVDSDIGGHHGLAFRFTRYLKNLAQSDKWAEVTERSCCVGCRHPAVNPYISDCWHIYCYDCLSDCQHQAARRGQDSMRCAECGETYSNAQPCQGLESLAAEASSTASPTDILMSSNGKKSKDSAEDDWINMPGEILPSAKTRAVKAQVLLWLEDSEAKIIIYSQFLPMIKILEKVCRTEGWDCCKYTGSMSHDARDRAINDFSEKKEKRILLASLKAGGLGLNLTMANKVLLVDQWWNSAVEQQAFARIYRIGQDKETELTRLIVTNTIDAAMLDIKERKDKDIDAVMNDRKRKEQLDVMELMRLFGPVRQGEDGKPFIYAQGTDNLDEGQEHLRFARGDVDDEEAFMGNEE